MGLDLSPLVTRQVMSLRALRGKSFAVDANNTIYQFLALIRQQDGRPFTDAEGRVTSHLMGLMFRTTRLVWEFDMKFIFVFDGRPPKLKEAEMEKRRELKAKAEEAYRRAVEAGDMAAAWSKAVMTSRFTAEVKQDARRLLGLLGIPHFEAPSEAEAQAAYLARRGEVWAVHSRDYDTLLFGAPRLVRHLTFTGREFYPKSGSSRPLEPEVMELAALETNTGLTRTQLVDAAILMGTDFNEGIYGIGPKKSVGLLKKYGRIEALPEGIRRGLPTNYEEIRAFFLEPPVVDAYPTHQGELDEPGLYSFLCDERGFARERVAVVVERMKRVADREPSTLDRWTLGP